MWRPKGLLAFVGASAGAHLAIVGAVVAVSRTEAPVPLPITQVDLVQESSAAYRRALARALAKGLPVLEARVTRATDRQQVTARPAAAASATPPASRLIPLPTLEGVVEKKNQQNTPSLPSPSNKGEGLLFVPAATVQDVPLADAAMREVSDTRPEARLNPLPPCGGGLGRGECLNHVPPSPRPVVAATAVREVTLASAALPEVSDARPEPQLDPLPAGKAVVKERNKQNTPSLPSIGLRSATGATVRSQPIKGEVFAVVPAATVREVTLASAALREVRPSPQIPSPGPLLRDGASRLLSIRPVGQGTDTPQHEVYASVPHPEEARRAVTKDVAAGAAAVAMLPPGEAIQPTASPRAPAQRATTNSARLVTPDAEVIGDGQVVKVRASPPPDPVQERAARRVIAAIDSAALKTERPPRRKPTPSARLSRADETPVPPRRKPPRPAVEPAPARLAPVEPDPARLGPAAEVARVLKTLKPKSAAEPAAEVKVEQGPSPEGANDRAAGEPILAATAALSNAAQASASAPAFQGAALGNAAPRYPYAARVRGVEGDVLLRVVVLPNGKAAEVTLRITSGSALLDRVARDAVRSWRFRPAKRGAQTVVGWVDVPVSFRLTD